MVGERVVELAPVGKEALPPVRGHGPAPQMVDLGLRALVLEGVPGEGDRGQDGVLVDEPRPFQCLHPSLPPLAVRPRLRPGWLLAGQRSCETVESPSLEPLSSLRSRPGPPPRRPIPPRPSRPPPHPPPLLHPP